MRHKLHTKRDCIFPAAGMWIWKCRVVTRHGRVEGVFRDDVFLTRPAS